MLIWSVTVTPLVTSPMLLLLLTFLPILYASAAFIRREETVYEAGIGLYLQHAQAKLI